MKIKLVSHASVIIDTMETRIWTDPWLFGDAFNESWSLAPPAVWDSNELQDIQYLWISHEHPDHFHIPTLRSLPDEFKERVTVLFQKNNSAKMFAMLDKLGYSKQMALPHRQLIQLNDFTEIYCYQEGTMNSCLAIRAGDSVVLNVNDAEIRDLDCRIIRSEVGAPDVILNQFSIAGYGGSPNEHERLSAMSAAILTNIVSNHQALGARKTIPFASFMYFSTVDNSYINEFANKPKDVQEFCQYRGVDTSIIYPGDTYDTDVEWDSAGALARYDRMFEGSSDWPLTVPDAVNIDSIQSAFASQVEDLRDHFPKVILALLRRLRVYIPDLDHTVEFSIPRKTFRDQVGKADPDLVILSQPLLFLFSNPYGCQTLGVGARVRVNKNDRTWIMHRIIYSLNNAELYLRPRFLISRKNLTFARERWRGSVSQLARRLRSMRS